MHFQHAAAIWRDFPALVPGVLYAENITADVPDANTSTRTSTSRYEKIAAERLASGPESELPEIQAWRRAFAAMGLKPTQYRCAAESLLRRFRLDTSGNIAVMFIIALIPILTAIGSAIDYSLATKMRAKMQSAADAASVASISQKSPGFTAAAAMTGRTLVPSGRFSTSSG